MEFKVNIRRDGQGIVTIWVGVNVLLKLELHIAADNMYGYRIEA